VVGWEPEGPDAYGFATFTGRVRVDRGRCRECGEKPCLATCPVGILVLKDDGPALGIAEEEAAQGKCIECLACELECQLRGRGGLVVELPLPEVGGISLSAAKG